MAVKDKLILEITSDVSGLKKGLEKSKSEVKGLSTNLKQIGGLLAGAFAIDKLGEFGRAIIDTTAEFQKFETVLTNTLGSTSEAQKALTRIQDFAAKTPFSVQELTDSFVRLANQGFQPTSNEMRKLGDLAASTGKDFLMLTEAVIDAQVGEFERLKEFGIRASKQGDQVTFAFKGVKTQVDFTSDSIQDYILSLGDLQGVSGAMEGISKTLGGRISNLGDSFDKLKITIGDALTPIISNVIGKIQTLFGLVTKLLDPQQALIDEFKATKTALDAMNVSTDGLNANQKILFANRKKLLGQKLVELEQKLNNELEETKQNLIDANVAFGDAVKERDFFLEQEKRQIKVQGMATGALEKTNRQINKAAQAVSNQRLVVSELTLEYQNLQTTLQQLKLDPVDEDALKAQEKALMKSLAAQKSAVESAEMGEMADAEFDADLFMPDAELQKVLDKKETFQESLRKAEEENNKMLAEMRTADDAEMQAFIEAQNAKIAEQDQLALDERLAKLAQVGEFVNAFTGTIQQGLTEMSDGLINSLGLADKGIAGFVKSMLKALAQVAIAQLVGLIQQKIMAKVKTGIDKKQAQGSAVATATNTAAAMGPAGLIALPGLIAGALALVTGTFAGIQAFAKGGVVTSPMMGLVGEAGPEAIIPLNRLDSMMGGGNKEFTIRGQDLVLAMDRANGFKSRITG